MTIPCGRWFGVVRRRTSSAALAEHLSSFDSKPVNLEVCNHSTRAERRMVPEKPNIGPSDA